MKLSWLVVIALVLIVGTAYGQSFTTDKGEIYPYGNAAMAGPNTLVLEGARVTLNNVQVFPTIHDGTQDPVVSASSSPHDSVYEAGWALQRDMESRRIPISDIASAMADLYKQSGQVDSVSTVVYGNSFWIRWKTDAQKELITVERSTKPPTREELARSEYDLLKGLLERNTLIVITSCGNYYAPPSDQFRLEAIRVEMQRATWRSNLTEEEFGQQWQNKELPAFVAWQFAHPISEKAMKGGK